MLQGHTYKTFKFTPGTLECREACLADDRCQSYNVVMFIAICELNNRTKEDKPEDFVKDKDRYYMAIDPKRGCVAVGVADKNTIPDARMTASSFHSSYYHPYYGRLNETRGHGGWCPETKSNRTDYLQVDMAEVRFLCAVATQGYRSSSVWTTSYKLQLSTDGVTWNTYEETNIEKVFPGNSNQNSIVKHSLRNKFKARYVRFYPVTYNSYPCLRIEISLLKPVDVADNDIISDAIITASSLACINYHPSYGRLNESRVNGSWSTKTTSDRTDYLQVDMECEPVGVADRNIIPDARMTASTTNSDKEYPYYGRLNEGRGHGVWCPDTRSERTDFLQVDMGTEHSVCAVATQGHGGGARVTSYKVRLSADGITWITYKEINIKKVFVGNSDGRSVVKNSMGTDVKARYVRFYPVTFNLWPCTSVEIYVRK
ncbi:Lactadherin [Stylophora pistillata]|uniref:Lactadherin n=1 Tax=Stylophora pistillata TaxID=50429 RepID=A0A2B4RET7_STYPI|nr:Lactadherin [Stylophora pistillata]